MPGRFFLSVVLHVSVGADMGGNITIGQFTAVIGKGLVCCTLKAAAIVTMVQTQGEGQA